jgi:hypothetical protein
VRRGERAQVHRDRHPAGGDDGACLGLPPPASAPPPLHLTSPSPSRLR